MSVIEQFLQRHPEVVRDHESGADELYSAVRSGNLPLVQLLIRLGCDINAPKPYGKPLPPIFSAASLDHTHVIRWLIEHGSVVNFTIDEKPPFCPMLDTAIRAGNDEMARLLIDSGALLNVHDRNGLTPLTWAIRCGRDEIATYIRERGGLEATQIPAWVPPVSADPITDRLQACFGPVSEFSWQAVIPDDVPVKVRLAWTRSALFGALFTEGMSDRAMNVPPGEDDFRYAELVLVLENWPEDPATWNSPEWNWPVSWLRSLAQRPFRENGWLGEPVSVVRGEEPLGPNTAMTSWLLISDKQPVGTFTLAGGKRVVFYTVMAIHTAEADFAIERGVPALLHLFGEENIIENLDRNRPCVELPQ